MLESEFVGLGLCSFGVLLRQIPKKMSFQELSEALFEGEKLVARYYSYISRSYNDVLLLDANQFQCWQQAEDAGTHILREVYAIKG